MNIITPPKELSALRKKAERKLVVVGYGQGEPIGIFTTVDGAMWAMRHFKPYDVGRWWWVQFFDTDIVDKKGSYKHSIHDKIVRWIFGEKGDCS